MQVTRIQVLTRHIGAPSRALPASSGRRPRARSVKIRQSGSFAFDLSLMKELEKPVKTSFFKRIEAVLFPKEKQKSSPLPKWEEFQKVRAEGRFPDEPTQAPFPTPFDPPKYQNPYLLRTTKLPDGPAEKIQDPILKKLNLLFCMKGRLLKSKKGLYYIKLPDKILSMVFPMIKKKGAEVPDHYMLIDNIGAHIPVIMPHEEFDLGIACDEVGETFYFIINGLFTKNLNNSSSIEKVWYLSFSSYDLEWLRQKNGLTSQLAGESFHCVVGIKKHTQVKPQDETFRISPIAHSA